MYDRISRALEAANLSNYLYRFKENELEDDTVELCLNDATLVDELRNIIPVTAHLIKFKSEFRKTQPQPQPFSYTSGQVPNQPETTSRRKSSNPSPSRQPSMTTTSRSSAQGHTSSKIRVESQQHKQKPDLRSELQDIFDAVDEDGSGRISVEELYKATTRSSDSRLSMDACRLMISMFDDDKKGSIEVMGFFSLILLVHEWQGAFKKFDSDHSGFLDRRELIAPLQEMSKGYLFDQQFVDLIVSRFGDDKGRLDSDGFVNALAFISTFTRGFRHKDKGKQGVISYQDFLTVVLNSWN